MDLRENHHVVRYCNPSSLEDGKPTHDSFDLKEDEPYLSVDWLEYFPETNKLEINLNLILKAYKKRILRYNKDKGVLAVFKKNKILKEKASENNFDIKIYQIKNSYSGIKPLGLIYISEILNENVDKIYSIKELDNEKKKN